MCHPMARRFLRLGPSHVAAATQCVAETFAMQSRTDPFTALFGYTPQHWASMAASFIRRSGNAARPLSVVAMSPSGDVEGVMLNEDWVTPTPLEYQKLGTVRNFALFVLFDRVHGCTCERRNGVPHALYSRSFIPATGASTLKPHSSAFTRSILRVFGTPSEAR